MKNNKTLKYTGIIQGVLIATLLLLAIWIQVTFLYNIYYCEDYTFDFLRNMGIGYWDLRNNSSAFFLINSIAETIAYFLGLMRLYVLKIIFQIIAAAALTLPVILGYLSIFRKNIVANGLIIAGSALTLLSACRSLFSIWTCPWIWRIYFGSSSFNNCDTDKNRIDCRFDTADKTD